MQVSPEFARGSPLLEQAYGFAASAHAEGETELEHPVAVACLLSEHGYGEEIVVAGFLHDVLEDTHIASGEIRQLFGSEVERLVVAMTEDEAITDYEERKAEHRARVARTGADVAAIYAADKLAKARLRHGDDPIPEPKLSHYQATLYEMRDAYPSLPF